MNVRHLAELAGILSVHALPIVESPGLGSAESFARLEEVFRRRSEAWAARMEGLCSGSHLWSALYAEDPRGPLIEEILVSEILTRIAAALLAAHGQRQGDKPACRFAADLFNHHQSDRRLALVEMLEMADAHNTTVRTLDRVRRRAERWTDILLGPLSCRFAVAPLAFDSARSQEYGRTILPYLTSPAGSGLFAAGLHTAFPETLAGLPAHAGYHRETAAAVLGLLPADLFEQDGGLHPLRTVRTLRAEPADRLPNSGQRPGREISNASPAKIPFGQLRRRQKP